VEAPVSGSIVLAAIMLKLGGYGLFKFLGLLQDLNINYLYGWFSIGLIGSSLLAILCLLQSDLKSLIAYSSVVHMGMVLVGLIRMRIFGLEGAFLVIVGHGLCSSGLFSLVNIIYERSGSRRFLVNKGLLLLIPRISLWWFLLLRRNISAPPSLNLFGEINLLISILGVRIFGILGVSLILFFSGGYNLYIYSASQHGKFYRSFFSFLRGKILEYHTLFLHWFPLNYLFLGILFFYLYSLKKNKEMWSLRYGKLQVILFRNHICFLRILFLEFFSFMFFTSGLLMLWDDRSYYLEWVIFSLNGVDLVGILLLDYMSCIFLRVVIFISGMVVIYSDEYMHGDKNIIRFIMVVLLFVFSMAMLIISPNIISILLGWDGLGLVSYVLVIYYNNERRSSSGILTAIRNRVGDVFLLLAIAWILNYGSWNFIFYVNCIYFRSEMTFLFWLVFLGAITKRAQIPFSAWLPAAIAAPTPVSALVHSSTLVTAGIYLIIRFFPLLSGEMLKVMMFVSLMTILISSLVANYEVDLKRIIALSTLRQLGLIIFSLSLGCYKLSFFSFINSCFI